MLKTTRLRLLTASSTSAIVTLALGAPAALACHPTHHSSDGHHANHASSVQHHHRRWHRRRHHGHGGGGSDGGSFGSTTNGGRQGTGGQSGDPTGGSNQTADATVTGTITSIDGTTMVVATEHNAFGGSITLDLSDATIYGGDPQKTEEITGMSVQDRVTVKLSVTEQVATTDATAGTPVPTADVYDSGQGSSSGGSSGGPFGGSSGGSSGGPFGGSSGGSQSGDPEVDGTVTDVMGPVVTIVTGVGATYTLNLQDASVYTGNPLAPASVSAISHGDTLYARLAVTATVAATDAGAGTPIPVAVAYDFAAGSAPTG